jgi:excisionase family DNA binding protein
MRQETNGLGSSTNAIGPNGGRLLTVEQVSEMLQVPVSWVREHVRREARDRIPAVKVGKYWRFRCEDILGWLDARKV